MRSLQKIPAAILAASILVANAPLGYAQRVQPRAAAEEESVETSQSSSAPIRIELQPEVPVRNDFQLGPTRFELELAPGETRTLQIELTSRMGRHASFDFEKEDFGPGENENDQTKLYGNLKGPYSAKEWLTPGATSVSLEHGERAFVPVTISVPANADPGDHYAAVMAKRESDEKTAGGIAIVSRVGILFLITVKGDVVRKGEVLSLSTAKSLYFNMNVPLSIRAKNEGTIRLYPEGTVDVKNLLGVTVDQIPVSDWVVLRNSTRSVQLTWKPTFALGRYTATTNIKINGQPANAMTVSFWVVPLLPVLGILIAIFLVSFFVQYFFARFEIKKK